MAIGDIVSDIESIAASGYLTIQPTGTEEWIIHNIYHEWDVDLQFYDGANALTFDTDPGANVYPRYAFHCNNTRYIRVKNIHISSAKLIGYDGVISHT
jgi:hypothetical protein